MTPGARGATLTVAPRGTEVQGYLPSPPDDAEKQWYMGRQHRWLLVVQALSFTMIAYSLVAFATSRVWTSILLVPVVLYALTQVVSLSSSLRGKRTSRSDHAARVAAYRPDAHPSVDVFLPSAGEPVELIANTFRHVAALQWPGRLTVVVLDDSDRSHVAALAQAHGFRYEVRPDRGHLKKAGNLGHGYRVTDGDLIAVFDADFVPRPDYLHELVPYFEEPSVGIVQSPQFFDTHTSLGWLQRCAGATQELFYRWIQPARDRSNAAICVGTCAVYRRAALERSGGFAQIGHSEDVHTGVNLLRVGFHVRYVPILVSKGVCPDSLSGFLNQQYRWCTGSMSLLMDRSFHREPHITFRQRLCFWSGFLYYVSTGVNATFALVPAIAMVLLFPSMVHPVNSVWLLGSLVLWLVLLPVVFRSRWRLEVLRVQLLYSFAHAVAIFHVVRGRTREWVPTGAAGRGAAPLASQILRLAKVWITVSQLLLWTGLIHGALTHGLGEWWAVLTLNLVTAYVQLPVLWQRTSPPVPVDRAHLPRPRRPEARTIDLRAS
ncbi:glycosyltransferase family 2 protein [Kineococcus aurantiacus]|uniref:Cellulose synthase/poly-beta-1,6-N-acetylglucosamine synthase-like glycosyltransferase n=2 Tax=Kineococcus aurantiacus TaxID=37633 RepID=A0A7Y9DNK4_9ACTN|nr:cellulose synthase/poly-beta-1,6-N-acetylglucosamine synthase-like glycosyltransferase [Kineococcus aurantiacus]